MAPSPPGSAINGLTQVFERTLDELRRGQEPLGERLLVFGSGPLPIPNAERGALALDRSGRVVLVAAFSSMSSQAAPGIADQLDRIANLSLEQLAEAQTEDVSEELSARYTTFFGDEATAAEPINRDQRALILVAERPPVDAWKALIIELGGQLSGVYLAGEQGLEALDPPAELRRAKETPAEAARLPSWLVPAALLLGVALIILGASRFLSQEESPAPLQIGASIRDVVTATPPDATHSQWIGQQRMARASDGRLLVLFSRPEGLQVVSDQSNQGRAWRTAQSVPSIRASSFSVAIDDEDRLHLVFSDGARVAYAVLREARSRWRSSPLLVLDPASKSPYVDIDWDRRNEVAHVVWAQESGQGQQPQWAAIASNDNGRAGRVLMSRRLSEPRKDLPVLATIAVDSASRVLVVYRRGEPQARAFSRLATNRFGRWVWGPEKMLPGQAPVGAMTLAFDARDTAHLVLRDSVAFRLLYFRSRRGGAWAKAETAVQGEANEEVDFPTLSLDTSSRLVYLFFQSNAFPPSSEVLFGLRDPATGRWEGPYHIAPAGQIPEGALNPTSMASAPGHPIVLWTKMGSVPTIQAAHVVP